MDYVCKPEVASPWKIVRLEVTLQCSAAPKLQSKYLVLEFTLKNTNYSDVLKKNPKLGTGGACNVGRG